MATDKSFAFQGSVATLSMLKSLPAMVHTSALMVKVGLSSGWWFLSPLACCSLGNQISTLFTCVMKSL